MGDDMMIHDFASLSETVSFSTPSNGAGSAGRSHDASPGRESAGVHISPMHDDLR